MMKKIKSQSSIITLFLILYFPFIYYGMQNVSSSFLSDIEGVGGIVNYFGVFFNIVAILYIFTKGNGTINRSNSIVILLFFWVALSLFNSFFTSSNSINILKSFNYTSMWATHFLLYYEVAKNNRISEERLIIIFIFLIVFAGILLLVFFNLRHKGQITIAGMNASYFIICLLPWTFLIKTKWLQVAMIIFCVGVIFVSMKRTSIIALVFQLLPFVIIGNGKKHIIRNLSISVILITIVFLLFQYINESFLGGGILERFDKASEDDMGNRLFIWTYVWMKFSSSSLFLQLFGHGYESFLEDGGIGYTAHNDYLETLYDYGLVSLFILVLLVISLCVKAKTVFKTRIDLGIAYVSSLVGFLVVSFTSHLIFIHPCQIVFSTALWGFVLGQVENTTIQKKRSVRNK